MTPEEWDAYWREQARIAAEIERQRRLKYESDCRGARDYEGRIGACDRLISTYNNKKNENNEKKRQYENFKNSLGRLTSAVAPVRSGIQAAYSSINARTWWK